MTYPGAVAADPSTHTLYVANSPNSVSVVDEASNTATIPVGGGAPDIPMGALAVDPSTDTVYMFNVGGVSVINGATNTVTATIADPGNAAGVAVDPSTDTVYLADDISVSVIDGASNTVTATIPVSGALAMDPSTDTVYVDNEGGVSVIDGTTNTIIGSVGVESPYGGGIAVDLATHTVYVTCTPRDNPSDSGTVSVITSPQPGPASVTATAGNTAAAVSWTAPASLLNGATVTGYTASAFPGNQTCSTTGATGCTITGLTNLTAYSISVIAHTSAGDSAAQAADVNKSAGAGNP